MHWIIQHQTMGCFIRKLERNISEDFLHLRGTYSRPMSIAGNKRNHSVLKQKVGGNFSVTAKVPEKTAFIALKQTSGFQPGFGNIRGILDAVITFGMCNDGNFAALLNILKACAHPVGVGCKIEFCQ